MKVKNLIFTLALVPILVLLGCKKKEDPAPTNSSLAITSADPTNNASGIARNKKISVLFNQAVNPTTVNSNTFTLKKGTIAIAGSIAYANNIATFSPSNVLESNTTYTVMITTGVPAVV